MFYAQSTSAVISRRSTTEKKRIITTSSSSSTSTTTTTTTATTTKDAHDDDDDNDVDDDDDVPHLWPENPAEPTDFFFFFFLDHYDPIAVPLTNAVVLLCMARLHFSVQRAKHEPDAVKFSLSPRGGGQ